MVGCRLLARTLLLVSAGLSPSPVFAIDQPLAQMHHTAWTARDGLTGSALCLAQTTDGFLWIGTSDGLYRFDGVRFERFQPQGGALHGVSVSALHAVPDGGLWVGYSRGGATFIDKYGGIVNYSEREGMPVGKVRSIARDPDGNVWLAAVGGVARLEGNRWEKVREDWDFPHRSGWQLFVDRRGTLWVGAATPDRILYLPKGARKFRDAGLETSAFALTQAPDGDIVFSNVPGALVRALPSEPDRMGVQRTVADLPTQVLTVDRHGALWIGGYDIVRLPPGSWQGQQPDSRTPPSIERFTKAQGLTGTIVSDVLEDREGNLWVATEGGLDRFRYRNLSWEQHRERAVSVTLVSGSDGDVWALSNAQPWLMRVQDRKAEPRAPDALVRGYRTGDDTILLTGEEAVWRWADGRFVPLDPPDVVRARRFRFHVISATSDRSGRLWLAINGLGEFCYDKGVWTFVEVLPGHSDLTAVAAHTDADDRVWLAYRNEVAAVKDGGVRVYADRDGLAIGAPVALGGRDRQIWVGGERGLAFLKDDRFHTVDVEGGGFGPVTSVIVPANDGVWLGAGAGIVHIPESQVSALLRDPAHRVKYDVLDLVSDLPEPLRTNSSTATAPFAVEGSDGVLWFVTMHGVARVDRGRIFRNPTPPPVVIQSMVADNRLYPPRDTVALPALTKTIRIDYTALSLSIPERVKFRYRLEGWETEWHDAEGRRSAFYTELKPGTYGFRVLASNNDGVWNDVGATLAFTVAPAWFQTAWFGALVVTSVCGLLLAFYRFRVRQIAAQLTVRFSERLDERTRLARELHDTMLQSVLGSKMLVDSALTGPANLERMRGAIEEVATWLAQAVEEGRAALNSLRTSTVEVNDLAAAFEKAAVSPLKPESMTVSVTVKGTAQDLQPMVGDEIYRIGDEAMRNAWRHSGGTHVDLEIEYALDLTLRISDDGAGIDPSIMDGGREGRFGLRGMRERAARIGSTLTIASSPAGTRITLVVPGRVVFRTDIRANTAAGPPTGSAAAHTAAGPPTGSLRRARAVTFPKAGELVDASIDDAAT